MFEEMNYIVVTEHDNAGGRRIMVESSNVVQVYQSDAGNAVIKFGNKATAEVTEIISTRHHFAEVAKAVMHVMEGGSRLTECTTDVATPDA